MTKEIHQRRKMDALNIDGMETREMAVFALYKMEKHEETCASRWGVIIKLMWAVLGGIGFIVINQLNNGFTHFFNSFEGNS